jgi:hypothetical protein
MDQNTYNCHFCEYKTDKKSNLSRHLIFKHSDQKCTYQCHFCYCCFTSQQSLTRHVERFCPQKSAAPNTNLIAPNTNIFAPNTNICVEHICTRCQKDLSTRFNLRRHASLECPICHKTFSTSSSKSRHMKSHAPKQIPIIFISSTDQTEFIMDDINLHDIRNAIQKHTPHADVFHMFVLQILQNPWNRCVRKTNMQNVFSYVHVGNNEWETHPDNEVFPKVVADIAAYFADLANIHGRHRGIRRLHGRPRILRRPSV